MNTRFENAHLPHTEYAELLKGWTVRGNSQQKQKTRGRSHREHFAKQLKDGSELWAELIAQGGKRLRDSERGQIKAILAEARGDPLMFVNLAGVPPLNVLNELEFAFDHVEQLTLQRIALSAANRKVNANALRAAARALIRSELILEQERVEMRQITKKLKTYAKVIEGFKLDQWQRRKGILVPSTGSPPKVDLYVTAKNLKDVLDDGLVVPDAKRSWGVLASLLLAGFPSWLKTQNDTPENLIRRVKHAYNRADESRRHVAMPLNADGVRLDKKAATVKTGLKRQ